MALSKDVNSYVTLAEAEVYFSDRIDAAAWEEASDDQKSKALVTASLSLNNYDWEGYAISDSQPLAFPRQGSYYEPKIGYEVVLDENVPDRIIKATYELAYHYLNNDGVLDDTGSLKSLGVGTINLDFDHSAGQKSSMVSALISPLLLRGGAKIWWRNN